MFRFWDGANETTADLPSGSLPTNASIDAFTGNVQVATATVSAASLAAALGRLGSPAGLLGPIYSGLHGRGSLHAA